MSVILFLLVLFVLVLVHEWGHFIVAKKTGMRVDEFGIGFPPKAWGKKVGETEYTLNWLPIGGFVRIWGENLEEAEQLEGEDISRSFAARPKWAQALVLIAGVAMNVIFAWFLFIVTFMIGVPTAVDQADATSAAQFLVAGTIQDSPAAVLPVGAEISSVSSQDRSLEVLGPQAFSDFVAETAPTPITVTYEVGGVESSETIVPVQGLSEAEPDRYFAGVSLVLVETQSQPFFTAVSEGTRMTIEAFTGIVVGLFTLIAESFAGTADYSQIAGPVGIVGLVGDAASFGLVAVLTFTAIISLNLAVINLLPVPALDGGRLMFVLIEAVTRKSIPAVWAMRVNVGGFVLLMLLMILVTFNDILRLL